MKKVIVSIFLATAFILQANPQKITLTFDIDGEVNYRQKLNAAELYDLLSAHILKHDNVDLKKDTDLSAFCSAGNKVCNGYSNLLRRMTLEIQKRGYGDFARYEMEIIEQATHPIPNPSMIAAMKQLKQNGYTLVGATNHDIYQHMAYRRKMRAQGVDMNEVFDVVLAVPVNYDQPKEGTPYYKLQDDENLYITSDYNAYKPHKAFFDALWVLCKHIHPTSEKMYFTDDHKENVDAAKEFGITAFLFYITPGIIEGQEVFDVLNGWKHELKEHGITI